MGTRTHRGLSTRDHNYLAVRSTWILFDIYVYECRGMEESDCVCVST